MHIFTIVQRAERIVKYMHIHQLPNKATSTVLQERFKKTQFGETGWYEQDVGYSINKQDIFLCVRGENDELLDIETGLFILLHEMAHIMSDSVGHTKEFEDNLDALLIAAKELDLYAGHSEGKQYCGQRI